MNADGSNQTRVTNHPALDALPSFSQNSKQIVFVSDRIRKGQRRLFVANFNGSGVRMLSRGTFTCPRTGRAAERLCPPAGRASGSPAGLSSVARSRAAPRMRGI